MLHKRLLVRSAGLFQRVVLVPVTVNAPSAPAVRRVARMSTMANPPGAQCSHCSADTPKLTRAEIDMGLLKLPNWQLTDDGTALRRAFTAKNWAAAIGFINSVSEIAEEANHHPDLHLTGYRNIEVIMQTHVIGGIAEIDLELAAKMDAIPVECSPKWLREHQAKLAERHKAPDS